MTGFPNDEATIRLSAHDQHAIRYAAERAHVTVREYLEGVIARHAEPLPMPPARWTPPPTRPKRSLSQVRAEQRATSEDGMSTYTRELQTITSSKEQNA